MKRAAVAAALALAGVALWVRLGPLPENDPQRFASTIVTDRNGVVLYEPLAASGARGRTITADQITRNVVLATVAAEDRRFFHHPGVDPVAIVRAAIHDAGHHAFVEGGSTITQQTAKLLLGSKRRTMTQKIREAVFALRLEHRHTKREILAMYLSIAPYGNGINGIVRASHRYFGCAPEDLTVAQAAFLASLPQRPSAYDPLRDAGAAVARQRHVIRAMAIDDRERVHAIAERLAFNSDSSAPIAQHFVERVLSRPHGRVVRTTIDAKLQQSIAGIIRANRDRLLKHGARSVAVAVLDNRTGQWLAWEGSGDYFGQTFGGAIDGVVTPRQPGSALKPFTYALAFEQGYSPATVLDDVPSQFPTAEEGVTYEPRNYDGQYRGAMRIRYALAGSENVPAVEMLSRLGPAALLGFLRQAGFTTFGNTADYYGLGLTLGDAEVQLDEMVTAYAAFARGGVMFDGRRLVSRRTAFWISDILSDPKARAFIFGSGSSLEFPFRVAVKTGTSQAYHDNWTVGFTRDVTVGVWVGNFDRSELRNSSGVTGAAPIFHAVMLAAVKRIHGALPIGDERPIVDPPPNVLLRPVYGANHNVIDREWLPVESVAPATTEREPAESNERLITHPTNGATYLIDPTLRAAYQRLPLEATATVSWKIDAKPVGRGASIDCELTSGTHTIAAIDDHGRRDEVRIYVK